MDLQIFNITKLQSGNYRVDTKYNHYTILIDKDKGIGIYLDYEHGRGDLLKQYHHCNIQTAINYLFKENIF